ncbi:MAG: acyl-CoA dehydrogenase family protein, partial [bacterium]
MVDFTLSPEIKELRAKAKAFLDEHIYPNEPAFHEGGTQAEALMKDLQARTKALGMWAMFIGPEAGGTGTGFLPYAYVNEILGRSPIA